MSHQLGLLSLALDGLHGAIRRKGEAAYISRGERVEISGEVLMFLCFREKKIMALLGMRGFTRM